MIMFFFSLQWYKAWNEGDMHSRISNKKDKKKQKIDVELRGDNNSSKWNKH